ncbi:MAG TPA: choice-of-anchor D domain-containing protein [Myxococcota bacterium]|nr:choice-of-anchor D domain-containing protein [Myxococcota bacterium]
MDALGPGESTELVVTFEPTQEEVRGNAVFIESDDPDAPLVEVPLVGSGLVPEILVTPLSFDFGEVALGQTQSLDIQIVNLGSADLFLDDIVVVYLDGVEFFESPVTFTASPGQELTFEGYDYWGNCRGIEETWLHNEELDVMTKLSSGRLDGCNGYASGMTLFFWARENIPAI